MLAFIYLYFTVCLIEYSSAASAIPSAIPSSVSTFVIDVNAKQTHSVNLVTAAGTSIGCKLEYDTSLSGPAKTFLSASEVVEKINQHGCLSIAQGIFTFKVCPGDKIEQSANGDTYSLGKYSGLSVGVKTYQEYEDGTFCDAAHASRRSIVEFVCVMGKPLVLSIEEWSVCRYRIVIGTQEVCGHPQFAAVEKVESWVLELVETDEGAVMCQAYNNGFDVVGSISFNKFSLALTNTNMVLTKYVVRYDNRKIINNVKVDASPARVQLQTRTSVDFAKIVAE